MRRFHEFYERWFQVILIVVWAVYAAVAIVFLMAENNYFGEAGVALAERLADPIGDALISLLLISIILILLAILVRQNLIDKRIRVKTNNNEAAIQVVENNVVDHGQDFWSQEGSSYYIIGLPEVDDMYLFVIEQVHEFVYRQDSFFVRLEQQWRLESFETYPLLYQAVYDDFNRLGFIEEETRYIEVSYFAARAMFAQIEDEFVRQLARADKIVPAADAEEMLRLILLDFPFESNFDSLTLRNGEAMLVNRTMLYSYYGIDETVIDVEENWVS